MNNPIIPIKNWGINGEGIGYLHRKPVFVENALPGETVRVEIIEEKPNYLKGVTQEILTESPRRRHPICPKWKECGGCALAHVQYKEQARLKEELLKEALAKYADYHGPIAPLIKNPNPLGYRNALKLPIGMENGEILTGMYRRDSHEFTGIDRCLVHTKALEYARNEIVDLLNFYPIALYDPSTQQGYRSLIMRELGGKIQVVLVTGQNEIDPQLVQEIMDIDGVVSVYQSIKTDEEIDVFGSELHHLAGDPELELEIGDLKLHLQPRSFYQLNSRQAEVLYETAVNMVPECQTLVEAYCGIGAMALMAASRAEMVIGIESIHDAVKAAEENAQANNIKNVRFICGDAADELALITSNIKVDCLIVDPPRTGLSDKMLEVIKKARINTIVYVSCNPSTLGKNLGILKNDYWIDKVQPVDLFSQTPHVEAVVLLNRRHPVQKKTGPKKKAPAHAGPKKARKDFSKGKPGHMEKKRFPRQKRS